MPSLRCSARISCRISARSCASRLDSGSSMRHTGASLMIARPSATRCCWPPESCDGLRASEARQPEEVGDAREARLAVRARTRAARAGRTGCSRPPSGAGTARSSGTPSRCCAWPAAAVTSRSPIRMRPPSAVSRPAMRRSVVDLPQPEGPSSTLSVPSPSANEMPSTARTWPSRGRPVLAHVLDGDGRHETVPRMRRARV